MKFSDFKTLIDIELQDGHSSLPNTTNKWNIVIKADIDQLLSDDSIKELAEDIAYVDLVDDDSEISIDSELTKVLLYEMAARFSNEMTIKQLIFLKRDDAISTFVWNKYRRSI